MKPDATFSRNLWVIPEDVFRVGSAEIVSEQLRDKFNCDVWLFSENTALAFSPRGLLSDSGMTLDYPAEIKITLPLFNYLDQWLIPDYDHTNLEIPESNFFTCMFLQQGEHDKRYCRYIKSCLQEREPFSFLAYANYVLTPVARQKLRGYLNETIRLHSTKMLYGERLNLGETEILDYSRPAEDYFYLEDGFQTHCSQYSPATWPWIEFYLAMRKVLPRKQRLSLQFFNTGGEIIRR